MNTEDELQQTIVAMVQPGKGILAADESAPTIAKRFKAVGVESNVVPLSCLKRPSVRAPTTVRRCRKSCSARALCPASR